MGTDTSTDTRIKRKQVVSYLWPIQVSQLEDLKQVMGYTSINHLIEVMIDEYWNAICKPGEEHR